jgi:hypothetical protein
MASIAPAATDWYVDPAASDNSGDGKSWANAKKTFSGAGGMNLKIDGSGTGDDELGNGDTIHVKTGGDGSDFIVIKGDWGTSAFNTIAIKKAVTSPMPSAHPIFEYVEVDNARNVELDSLRIDRDGSAGDCIYTTDNDSGNYFTIKNCRISWFGYNDNPDDLTSANWASGYNAINWTGQYVTIDSCTMKNVRGGIAIGFQNITIKDCELDGWSKDGINLTGGGGVGSYENMKILDCYLHDHYLESGSPHDDFIQIMGNADDGKTNGIFIERNRIIQETRTHTIAGTQCAGIRATDSKIIDSYFRNNLIWLNNPDGWSETAGIVVDVGTNGDETSYNSVFILYNTVIGWNYSGGTHSLGKTKTGIDDNSDDDEVTMDGNLLVEYSGGAANIGIGESDGTGTYAKDKLWQDPPTGPGDYLWNARLKCSSSDNPAIDGAPKDTGPSEDLEGNSRPVDITDDCDEDNWGDDTSDYDYGCYEKQS